MITDAKIIKKNGIFYSPHSLASLLVSKMQWRGVQSVLDPACGDGALLSAVAKHLKKATKCLQLVGCDLFLPNDRQLPPGMEFIKTDFINFSKSRLFDVLIMNPPYVPFGAINNKQRQTLIDTIGRQDCIPGNADLWCYFLAKGIQHLNVGGNFAAILPWAFLEAAYSKSIRMLLANNFSSIKVLALNQEHFESTDTRVVLLWCHGYQEPHRDIEMAFAGSHADSPFTFEPVSVSAWREQSLFMCLDGIGSIQKALNCNHQYLPFGEYANVQIGMVTGANKYFILPPDIAKMKGFSARHQIPILVNGNELQSLTQEKCEQVIVRFPSTLNKRQTAYLKQGIDFKIDKRSHSIRRSPWYKVCVGNKPDAFFTYRVSTFPFLVLNPNGYQCTNSIHRVYFKPHVNQAMKEWLQISLLSLPSIVQMESLARHYGRSVLKLEPSACSKILVHTLKRSIARKDYFNISKHASNGDRLEAVRLATKLVAEKFGLPLNLLKRSEKALNQFRVRRGHSEVSII